MRINSINLNNQNYSGGKKQSPSFAGMEYNPNRLRWVVDICDGVCDDAIKFQGILLGNSRVVVIIANLASTLGEKIKEPMNSSIMRCLFTKAVCDIRPGVEKAKNLGKINELNLKDMETALKKGQIYYDESGVNRWVSLGLDLSEEIVTAAPVTREYLQRHHLPQV